MDTAALLDQTNIELGDGGSLFLSFVLAMMIFAVALGLRPSNFAFFKKDPKHFLAGAFAQLLGLPLLTLILVHILDPAPSLALGMILVSCCPGGNVSNIMALFARANTALSVSMTATSSLAAAFLTPISILFWSSLYAPTNNLLTTIDFNPVNFLIQSMFILALPICAGMLIAWKYPRHAMRLQKPLAMISGGALILIIVATFYQFRHLVPQFGALIVPLVMIHNLAAFALGYTSGLVTKADIPTRRALTIEVGIQNSGLGFVLLVTQLAGLGGAAAITAFWGLWHIVAGLTIVGLFRYSDKRTGRVHV
ncbi:MAG: bile acid:sodium symporter family protein [Acidimicrobiales bacterium]|nr:bile acid:sodium symporter family protein [Hyphomonadaceae bacterium]RZV43980.1 MAG: bile acid:sodium symporter family protein [Acidimicrobiales bacterium]